MKIIRFVRFSGSAIVHFREETCGFRIIRLYDDRQIVQNTIRNALLVRKPLFLLRRLHDEVWHCENQYET